jgi:glycogen operon protein
MDESTQGRSHPIGATLDQGGVNFCLFSRTAAAVDLLLFDAVNDTRPSRVVTLDPLANRTYHYWHGFVPGVEAGQVYGYRVHGAWDPSRGLYFDPSRVLLDPYGRAVAIPEGSGAMKSVVVDPGAYDWQGDQPLCHPCARTIIYEMHVRGFTAHPSSGIPQERRGTYAGLIEKIPYLQDLGITAVELLPVFAFDRQAAPSGHGNYWGYQPLGFFAPHPGYSCGEDPLAAVDEFRDMVKALHRAGIEVILDVVFNHTAEGGVDGPTFCFRGIDNPNYYLLKDGGSQYADYSGCGNTLNANHPVVRRMIIDSLRYWVAEMHVDGFRFDLASILARDSAGHVLPNPPVLWDIESDPLLAGTKLIAEAWDAAGLYQVGSFVGDSWREWNGRFRDDARDFFRSAPGSLGRFADRLIGSPQIYGHKQREAEQSINFVTCHDGFTLNDLVSYNEKHNEANGENNRDGTDDNRSWNCGQEGPSDDPAVESLRNRQIRNFFAVTLLSLGVPMLLMGDEVRRTQHGNNNAYSRDDSSTWFDWTLLQRHGDLHRFVKLLIARRLLRDLRSERERTSLNTLIRQASKAWHGTRLDHPDWSDQSHSIALTVKLLRDNTWLHLILNAYWHPLDFDLPTLVTAGSSRWHRWIDTSRPSPNDIVPWEEAPECHAGPYRAAERSVAVLIAGEGVGPRRGS